MTGVLKAEVASYPDRARHVARHRALDGIDTGLHPSYDMCAFSTLTKLRVEAPRYRYMPTRDLLNVNRAAQVRVSPFVSKHRVSMEGQGKTPAKQIRVGTAMSGWYRWLWLRALLGTAAFISLVTVCLGDPKAYGFGSALAIRAWPLTAFSGASLVLLLMGYLSRKFPKSVASIARVPSTSMTPAELLGAKRRAAEKYSPEVLVLFSRMLKESSQYIARAVEDVEVEEGCLRLKTRMEFALNDEAVQKVRDPVPADRTQSDSKQPAVILIPLIKLAKGATLDNLDLSDADGRQVSPLLQDETYGLLAYVIHDLFYTAYINGNGHTAAGGSGGTAPRVLSGIEEQVLRSLLQLVTNPEAYSKLPFN